MNEITPDVLSYIEDVREQITPRTFNGCLNLYTLATAILESELPQGANEFEAHRLCKQVRPILSPETSKEKVFEVYPTTEESIEVLKKFEDKILDALQAS